MSDPLSEPLPELPPLPPATASREELALAYFERLPYVPYPVQEQAIYAWFEAAEGVLVCAPTGTGKTLIAEAAIFEALCTNKVVYYTTPLIALTEQKFRELQATVVRWGFREDDVGLVTGNRRVNPQARVLVVVAEILLNRLLEPVDFPFDQVAAVVMDEFHSFIDPERGIVWEFSLSMLPAHVRLLLLSATVGNAVEFLGWLRTAHRRNLELVQSSDRKVPLEFQWIPDQLLTEQLQKMAQAEGEDRLTPALVFCFNRDECWQVAEELKGKDMLQEGQQKQILARLERYDFTRGAGTKLRPLLLRGVGVHHAGILPRYRRIVEELFQEKLLTVCVCTETLAAGINLPARSVVIPSLLKGPPGKLKVIDPSSAHQIFGRAGRPQFDSRGFVFALPHEDDVRILRWKEKFDQIPEDTRDPQLLQAKKALKKKQVTRSPNRQYWNESQFEKLRTAPPRHLQSQGPVPWRLLAYMLRLSPEIERIRKLASIRLQPPKQLEQVEAELHRMLITLHHAEIIRLEPPPPGVTVTTPGVENAPETPAAAAPVAEKPSAFATLILKALNEQAAATGKGPTAELPPEPVAAPPQYRPEWAHPLPKLEQLFLFRGINPVYALFLLDLLGKADESERIQLFESVLELPASLVRYVRVPHPDKFPPGPLARDYLDMELVTRGIITADDLYPQFDPKLPPEERKYAPNLGEKARMLFEARHGHVHGVFVRGVWAAGDLLFFNCKFDNYIRARDLAKQEGLIHRHVLRLVLLLGEFAQVTPTGLDPDEWREWLRTTADRFTSACLEADPQTTEQMLAHAAQTGTAPVLVLPAAPTVAGDGSGGGVSTAIEETEELIAEEFGAGLLDE
jgi:superfamily II DNA/RNA helicase